MAEILLETVKSPQSPISEAYRTLRSNIQFSSMDAVSKTIVITSSRPGEGKTTTSSNLAVSTAQAGNKTILLDCDMRNPKIHKVFGITNKKGLSDLLIGIVDIDNAIQKTDIENLFVLTSGTKPPNPSELLSSQKMRKFIGLLKERFDYIIIDTPPVMMVTDAQIASQYADGCLLVVASGESDRAEVMRAKELLEKVNAKILGVVLNKIDTSKKGYYRYYYPYYGDEHGKRRRKSRGAFFKIFRRNKKHNHSDVINQ